MKRGFQKIIISIFIIALIFSSGCLEITYQQKLKRNGKYDITITFKATSSEVLNLVKNSFQAKPGMSQRVEYTETETTASYHIKDIDPRYETLVESDGEVGRNTMSVTKDFRFPYYYYRLSWDYTETINPEKTEYDQLFESMFKLNQVVDVFGTIIETNGKRMSNNRVKFDMTKAGGKPYYVEFKDFFLFTWFGALFGGGIGIGLHPYALILLLFEIIIPLIFYVFVLILLGIDYFTGWFSRWNYQGKLKTFLVLVFLFTLFCMALTIIIGVFTHKDIPTTTQAILEYKEPDTSSLLGDYNSATSSGTVRVSCSDGIKNGDESGIDCGGTCEKRCHYSVNSCPSGHTYTYKNTDYDTVTLTVNGKKATEWGECCLVSLVVELYKGDVRHEQYICREKTISKMYDVGGKIVGTSNGFIGTAYLTNEGYFINQTTCIDEFKNQGEQKIDCGGPCKPCPVIKAVLNILDVESKWTDSEWLGTYGTVSYISYQIENTGDSKFGPRLDVYLYKGTSLVKQEIGAKSYWSDLSPSEKKIDKIYFGERVESRGQYKIKVNVREGDDAEVITSAEKSFSV